MSTETLYLIIERRKRWHTSVRISRICRKKPRLMAGQALVRLNVNLPSGILEPPVCNVEIKPEHIAQGPVTISSQQP